MGLCRQTNTILCNIHHPKHADGIFHAEQVHVDNVSDQEAAKNCSKQQPKE
jgi:hypothetical protein